MPNSFAGLAQRFPAEKEGQSLEEQVRELRDYSYQLLEYLRYALQHLDPSNFNEKEMEDWITKPIRAEIKDVDGNMAQLVLTAEQLATRLQNAEGSVSQLQQTAQGIQTAVSNQSGQISSIQQTASGIQSTVADLSGKYSSLKQTVDGFDFTGVVTFSALEDELDGYATEKSLKNGTTTIDGDCITTGTITADKLEAGIFEAILEKGNISAFDIYDEDEELAGSFFYNRTNRNVYLGGYSGDLKIQSTGDIYIDNDLWTDVASIASSDANAKHTMTYDLDAFAGFYRTLKPCRFKYNNGTSDRFHTGFIAQEVEQAIAGAGFDDTDLAVVVQKNHGTEEAGDYGIRYTEIIALNTAMIQKLMDENDALKARVAALEGGNDVT